MMNVGPLKGGIIDEEIRKKKPTVMAELGGYTGYSAREREMVEIAGLSSQVAVYVGPFSGQYEVLRGKMVDASGIGITFYFIDHDKRAYLSDFKLVLDSKTLAPDSIIAADK
ncbi:hypothetical protein JM18_003740 [Phytophthora kernoviae]|uniref:Uncharacterized protein n=2 Tax=Phytophthora kernoviae TaxID=325452 RepID=A0A8T0LW02_9STRA|nr:hypothetical protein G195_007311 [Phytophthora kernoviae 00238/432]KAG2521522.1 hypothetical protein JM16_003570 [Phytophthora kernoviae]KAG2522967.1 hypothetical protein JM18_003740 [Phytophthora kernoviae]